MKQRLHALLLAMPLLVMSMAHAADSVTQLPTLAPVLKNTMPAIVNVAVQGITPSGAPTADGDRGLQSLSFFGFALKQTK